MTRNCRMLLLQQSSTGLGHGARPGNPCRCVPPNVSGNPRIIIAVLYANTLFGSSQKFAKLKNSGDGSAQAPPLNGIRPLRFAIRIGAHRANGLALLPRSLVARSGGARLPGSNSTHHSFAVVKSAVTIVCAKGKAISI